ncbi:hypothetical protein ACFFYR_36350 [Paraburkholderia dipogonis]
MTWEFENAVPQGGKSPGFAIVLSLFCVGAGQVYNGDATKGGFMFLAAVAGGVVLGFGAWLLIIPLIIYGMVDASQTANAINAGLVRSAEERKAAAVAAAKYEAETVSAQDFVTQIEKLHRLSSSNLLSAEEFAERKKQVLLMLHTRRPRESAEDFLTVLIPLARSEALSGDELMQIKSLVL